jgi:hypothetical protein
MNYFLPVLNLILVLLKTLQASSVLVLPHSVRI